MRCIPLPFATARRCVPHSLALVFAATLVACGGGGGDETLASQQSTLRGSAAADEGTTVSGAIFTTNVECNGTNVNTFGDKTEVFLDGGPRAPNAAGLPDGNYFVKVTSPDGVTLLGSTPNASAVVTAGKFAVCYQLSEILVTPGGAKGYDDTPNAGGVYKVWVSKDPGFPESASKTDNFKVGSATTAPTGELTVEKFYDANANGVKDGEEPSITGWIIGVASAQQSLALAYYPTTYHEPVVTLGTYEVSELMPVEQNWKPTTPTAQTVEVLASPSQTLVQFGNLCLGAGGGKTLGFWSNRNGLAMFGSEDLAYLVSLNLRNAAGDAFDPATYTDFRTWILGATATNMAYMLSAQMAASAMNVFNGLVSASSLIYAPGATSANALGYAPISAVIAEANDDLASHGLTNTAGADRDHQEALKNALDRANNNLNFVQPGPENCPFSFVLP